MRDPWEGAIFRGKKAAQYIRNLPFGMLSRLDPGNHALDGSADVPTEMQSIGFGGWVKT